MHLFVATIATNPPTIWSRRLTHETTLAKLDWLREQRDGAAHAGTEAAVEKQRAAGKLLARERAERLCDPGTFVELDRFVRHRESNFGMLDRRPPGDAVVTGYGQVFGRRVFVFCRTSRSSAARSRRSSPRRSARCSTSPASTAAR